MNDVASALEVADYRRQVAAHYREVRDHQNHTPERRWQRFVAARSALLKHHPQSPLDPAQRAEFDGLDYFAYDPEARVVPIIDDDVDDETFDVHLRTDGRFAMTRLAKLRFSLYGTELDLTLFAVEGYGGGLFIPFRDATNGHETYGGGRYLLDTIKRADLGSDGGPLVLDFNYAYYPSCAYHPSWDCPLAPIENRLPIPVAAGERGLGMPNNGEIWSRLGRFRTGGRGAVRPR